ncbi:hypothetical protein EC957_008864 [Mortierella hygrophila]|uniref:Uncharacterized protein n=1 Tax=Mortierella hygrophila TaxID=979708 RepID=A0A9P6EVW2_9FUNG|nr:hypothetical protein EC957_008864 [Mortierella hygrophila]
MRISVLPSWIKEASDGIEEDLIQRTCHVDFTAMFFALLNSRAFYGTVNIEARKARLHHSLKATVATNVPEGEQKLLHSPPEAVELGSPSIKHARLTLGAPSGPTPTARGTSSDLSRQQWCSHNWERFSRTQTSHTGPSAPAPIDQAPPLYKKINLDIASPVEDIELSGLKPSIPRPYKPKDPTTTNEQAAAAPVAKKKKKKKLLSYHLDKRGYAALKKSFKSVFATVTLTTGSVKGCLKRATDLTPANVDMVAQRLDMAVSIVNTAKHFVYKMLEMRILGELLSSSPPTSFLDDILDSDWAEIVIGNLLSFVFRDSTKALGPTANKPKSKEAQAEAVSIFTAFKMFHPGFKAVNPSSIPLGVVLDDLAPTIYLAMKLHYRKLPQTIRTKLNPAGGVGTANAMHDVIKLANRINGFPFHPTVNDIEDAFKAYESERIG